MIFLSAHSVLNYGYDNKFIIAYQIYDGSDWYNSNQIKQEKKTVCLSSSQSWKKWNIAIGL